MSYNDRIVMQRQVLDEMAQAERENEVFYLLCRETFIVDGKRFSIPPKEAYRNRFIDYAREVHDAELTYQIGVEAMSFPHFTRDLIAPSPEEQKATLVKELLAIEGRVNNYDLKQLAHRKAMLENKSLIELRDALQKIELKNELKGKSADELRKIIRSNQSAYTQVFPPLPAELTGFALAAMSVEQFKQVQKKYGNTQINARLAGRV